jgi:hypothetical protein
MGERNEYMVSVETLNGRVTLGDLGRDERMILRWILKKQDIRMWTVYLVYIRDQWWACVNLVTNFWNLLSTCWLLTKEPVLWN